MTQFISCQKFDDACFIANLFFKEVVWWHGLHRSIVSNQDSKFLSQPQIDGQTKVVNKTLIQPLRCMISKNRKGGKYIYLTLSLHTMELMKLWLTEDVVSQSNLLGGWPRTWYKTRSLVRHIPLFLRGSLGEEHLSIPEYQLFFILVFL